MLATSSSMNGLINQARSELWKVVNELTVERGVLAISRRLARQMGGDLELESHQGEGASFVLSLPIV